jgi:hypothetical protein
MASLRIMATGTADVDAIRSETFRGRTYTVVPVVALVEGVLQGLNAAEPEFAPASEFGKFPMTWNNRPITLNHPSRDGVLCSAGDPDIREEFEFGFIAGAKLSGKKLKLEAWLDDELIEEKGGEFAEVKQRLDDGEMVEVSTGLFCDVFEKKGKYNGDKYAGAWANVVPDHLAFLPDAIGACSIEDGCGAPRLNTGGTPSSTKTGTPAKIGDPAPTAHAHGSCCDACAKGDTCMSTNSNANSTTTGGGNEDVGTTIEHEAGAGTPEGGEPVDSQPAAEPGSAEEAASEPAEGEASSSGSEGSEQVAEQPATPEELAAEVTANAEMAAAYQRLTANAIAPEVTFENARTIVQQALSEKWPAGATTDCGCCYYGGNWISAMNSEWVAFERRDKNYNYHTVAVQYSIDSNGGVTFTGEPVPVNLIVSIVPKPAVNSGEGITANGEAIPGANQQQEEGRMADENQAGAEGAGGDVNANGAGNPPAPRTLSQYLAEAPPELRDILSESVELRTQKKTKLVDGILANSQLFSKDELEGKDIKELEKLHTMSQPKPNFQGRAFPSATEPQGEGISANGQRDNQFTVPEPVRAFSAKPVRRADYSDQGADGQASVN